MNLHRLKTFALVVQLESFSRAAEELFLSQPAVSLQVRQLERELGATLIDRGGGRIKATPAGEAVLAFASTVETEHTNLLRQLAALHSEQQLVTIGCSSTSAKRYIPLVISEVRRRAPEVRIRVMILPPDEASTRLAKGELDLILTTEKFLTDRLEAERYTYARLFLVGPPTHPLTRMQKVSADEVAKHPFALLPAPWSVQRRVVEWAENQGVDLNVVMELASYDGLIQAVSQGTALSVIAETAVANAVERGELAIIRTPGMPLEYPIFLAHRKGPLSPHVALVKAVALERTLSQALPRLDAAAVTAIRAIAPRIDTPAR